MDTPPTNDFKEIYVVTDIELSIDSIKEVIGININSNDNLHDYALYLRNEKILQPSKPLASLCRSHVGLAEVQTRVYESAKIIDIVDITHRSDATPPCKLQMLWFFRSIDFIDKCTNVK